MIGAFALSPALAAALADAQALAPYLRKRAPIEARVYLADGTEVFITQVCTRCHRAKPLRAFGLRRMPDGKVRSIPQCRRCRAGSTR